MLKGVFLLNQAGETIISLGNGMPDGDSSMLGGLVGAVQMFVHKMSYEDVRSISLDDLMMYMRKVGDNHLVTLHDENDALAEIQSHRIFKFVSENPAIGSSEGFVKLVTTMLDSEEESF
ncbi:MAG: hypothetical protein ACFFED_04210 [Candidatus Thorarchaeota archaeon]